MRAMEIICAMVFAFMVGGFFVIIITDSKDFEERIITDPDTGCQYLESTNGTLIYRLGRDMNQKCLGTDQDWG